MRLYYDDPYRKAFRSRVVAQRDDAQGHWVALEETAFYPESGGQPADRGRLGGAAVEDVQADEQGDVWHLVSQPVAGEVEGEIDGERRLDHMEQHAGQHIASGAFLALTGRDTISFHMGAETSTFDLAGRTPPTPEELAKAQDLANRVIRENRPITVRWVGPEEIASLGLRKPPQVAPPYRIVEVADFDRSACGGTHPASTAEVGLVQLYPMEPVHDGFRIRFYAGQRARRDYAQRALELDRIAAALGVAPLEASAVLGLRLQELDRLRTVASRQRRQLLDQEADGLARSGEAVFLSFPERGPDDLRELAARLATRGVPLTVLTGTKDELGAIVLQRPAGDGPHLGDALKALTQALGGRGGGSAVQAQGAVPLPAKALLDEARRRLGAL